MWLSSALVISEWASRRCVRWRRHRGTGKYEAHLWDKNAWSRTKTKKGRQGGVFVYLSRWWTNDSFYFFSGLHLFDFSRCSKMCWHSSLFLLKKKNSYVLGPRYSCDITMFHVWRLPRFQQFIWVSQDPLTSVKKLTNFPMLWFTNYLIWVANELHCLVLIDFGFRFCKKKTALSLRFNKKKERWSAVKKNTFWIKLKGLGLFCFSPLMLHN
jgi:hypothetical protein